MAEEGIRLYFTSGFFAGMNILLSAFYAAVEQPVPAQILSLLRGLILIVPLALLLSALWGVRGLWITLTVVEAAVLVLALLLLPRSPALKK